MSKSINETTMNSTNTIDTVNENNLPKVVKTLSLLAFLQGYERNDYRAWTRNSTEDCPLIDNNLIPSLTKHIAEFAKNLGEVLPKNPYKRGIQILDRNNARILPGEQLMSVLVEISFVKLYKELTTESIAYAVKNMNPNFEPDRYLIALQISEEGIESPCKEASYFEGGYLDDIWTIYVKRGECRHYFKKTDEVDKDGNPIYEDTGLLEFPERSAWEYLEEKKHRVVGNTKMIDFLRGLYKKDDIPTPVGIKNPVKEFKRIVKNTINVKKDQLGSIGDNIKIQTKGSK